MSHKRRIAAAVLCVCFLLGLTCHAASREELYFVAVENVVAPLTEETMPFWHDGYLYVCGDIFTGAVRDALGISRAKIGDGILLYRGEQSLLFRNNYPYAQGSQEETYAPGMVWREGNAYVPASVVARYFDLSYSTVNVRYGKLVWLREASFTMNADAFAKAAEFQLNTAYREYLRSIEPEDVPEPEPETSDEEAPVEREAEFEEPTAPSVPATTARPFSPFSPSMSAESAVPSEPATPSESATTTKPAAPSVPDNPATPPESTTPVNPVAPSEPATTKPAAPPAPPTTTNPAAPSTTTKPVTPSVPATTTKPVTPSAPAVTTNPAAPVAPAVTTNPVTPPDSSTPPENGTPVTTTEPPPDSAPEIVGGREIYLCLRGGESTSALLDALERRDIRAAVFCDEAFLSERGDLLRRMAATGHRIGLYVGAEPSASALERLEAANERLRRVTMEKTRLVYADGADETLLRALQDAGFLCLRPSLDRTQFPLRTTRQADELLTAVSRQANAVTVWLGGEVNRSALNAFVNAALEVGDTFPTPTEIALF